MVFNEVYVDLECEKKKGSKPYKCLLICLYKFFCYVSSKTIEYQQKCILVKPLETIQIQTFEGFLAIEFLTWRRRNNTTAIYQLKISKCFKLLSKSLKVLIGNN